MTDRGKEAITFLASCQDMIHAFIVHCTCSLFTSLGPDHPWCASGNALTYHCACVSTWWNTVLCHFWQIQRISNLLSGLKMNWRGLTRPGLRKFAGDRGERGEIEVQELLEYFLSPIVVAKKRLNTIKDWKNVCNVYRRWGDREKGRYDLDLK